MENTAGLGYGKGEYYSKRQPFFFIERTLQHLWALLPVEKGLLIASALYFQRQYIFFSATAVPPNVDLSVVLTIIRVFSDRRFG